MSITMEYFQMLILKNNKILKKSDFLKEILTFSVYIYTERRIYNGKDKT